MQQIAVHHQDMPHMAAATAAMGLDHGKPRQIIKARVECVFNPWVVFSVAWLHRPAILATMRLNWNEIRARAAQFATDWADAHYEKGETQSFYDAFFNVFGIERRQVARFEENVTKLNDRTGFIDLYWPKVLIVEQKSAGRNLTKAAAQAGEYFDALPDDQKPRYQLVCDFQNFMLLDRDTRQTVNFKLADLPDHVDKFGFIVGLEKRSFKDQDPVNIKAAEKVGRLHDALYDAGYRGHDLEVFLTRIVFCLFADDTGIFDPRDLFLNLLLERTREDGSDMGGWLAQLFQVLNTPENMRQQTLDDDLVRFPYVNGGLFEGAVHIPAFDSEMRARLIDASRFNWAPISPAIFGSLFQSVMNAKERRAAGAHYTTEMNILKVIGPLFMDDLHAEFSHLKALKSGRKKRLMGFHDSLRDLTFFDPACGCGNFLIIAYRELRLLELEILHALYDNKQRRLDAEVLSKIDVDQFYGIEIGEFPARIAETALWMMDHIMNTRLSDEFGQVFLRIPLLRSPRIIHGDALVVDWNEVLPASKCSYVLGNPPFIGAKFQSVQQRQQVREIADLGKTGGTLDFVCAWFIKAGDYIKGATRIGFVSTNSITQGEQVAQLWPVLFERCKLEIGFAHQTFAWGSEARGKAAVHVVIIGLESAKHARAVKRLFAYPDIKGEPEETPCKAISPYLFDASGMGNPHVVVRKSGKALSIRSKLEFGNMPNDGGNLILDKDEAKMLRTRYPESEAFIRLLIGANSSMSGIERYCLWLADAPISILKVPPIRERIGLTREYRQKSSRPATIKLADYPMRFGEIRQAHDKIILVPRHGSADREYFPISRYTDGEIAHDSCQFISNGSLVDFSVLSSKMHYAWLNIVGGKIKSDPRYSIGLVYNTFPLPKGDLSKLTPLATAILDARATHPDATLADLYDPDLMPADLRRAHIANDKAVDRMYRRTGFDSERARVEHLFAMYEAMQAPLLAKKPRRRRR